MRKRTWEGGGASTNYALRKCEAQNELTLSEREIFASTQFVRYRNRRLHLKQKNTIADSRSGRLVVSAGVPYTGSWTRET